MNQSVESLLLSRDLNFKEAKHAFRNAFCINSSDVDTQKKILILLEKKGISSAELHAMVALIREVEPIIRHRNHTTLADGCGTGGDGKNTFNISTIACLVAAASGLSIAKHGNRSISSRCGSSDLMESLGVPIEAPKQKMLRLLHQKNFGFFHAPLYHPFFAQAQKARRELAAKHIKTIFNLTGPLVNPLRPRYQLIGVYRKDLASMVAQAAKKLGFKRAFIIWNLGGYDELTTTNRTLVFDLCRQKLISYYINPTNLGFKKAKPASLLGGNLKKNLKIARNIICGREKSGAKFDAVVLTAATLLFLSGQVSSLTGGIKKAKHSLVTRKVSKLLKDLSGH